MNADDLAWMREGLCRETGGVLHFPEHPGDSSAAKAICALCPVLDTCRAYITELERQEGPQEGIWGGLTVNARRAIRRHEQRPKRPKPIKCGTYGGATTHRRRGETPCEECLRAERVYSREKRARRAAA